ncbi:aldehyde dehydrogenase domain-containing protein [Melampsora americana]|nr:aldehyde dehydrogenase domain-containing protein [Melampsora americana]
MPPSLTLNFPADAKLDPVTLPTGLFINNEFVDAGDLNTLETIDPTTGKVLGRVASAGEADVDKAVEAATKAYNETWGLKTPGHQRGRLMIELAQAMEENADTLAAIESLDSGKAYSFSRNFDVPEAANCLRYYGGWADKHHGQVIEVNDTKMAYTRHEPIGVVGQLIPCLLMFVWKIGPALATGNTIVIKPSELTPLSAIFMAKLIAKIFPPGVINILFGSGPIAGQALASHMKVGKIAFTGSTAVGKLIMKAAAESNLKDVTLELGGKSPSIVFQDADLEQAVKWAAFGIFFNQGQTCAAGSRVYVQEGIYDKFVSEIENYTKNLKIGSPFDQNTFHGPQISQQQFDRIMNYIKSGEEEGAKVLIGGKRHNDQGYFIQPTIFVNVKPEMKIVKEEIFGPVVTITKFKDEEELLKLANDSIYGLAAAVFTQDINRALKTSNQLQAGTVWINCYSKVHSQVPFGGYKQSGIGREMGEYALTNYTSVKAVHVNLTEKL